MHLCTHASLHGTQHTSFGCSCRSSRFLETLRECRFASPASVAADWPPVSATARSKELRRPDTCARVSVMAKSSRACACTRARRTMVLKATMCCMVLRATMVCRTVDSAVCAFRRGPASRHDNSAGGGGGALADFFREQWSVREYNIIPYDQTVPFQGKGARGRRQGSKTIRGRSSRVKSAGRPSTWYVYVTSVVSEHRDGKTVSMCPRCTLER